MLSLVYFRHWVAFLTLLAHMAQADVCDMTVNDAAQDACAMQRAMAGSSVVPHILHVFSPTGALYAQYGNIVIGGAQQLSPSRVYKLPGLSLALIHENPAALHYAALCLDFQPSTRATRLIWLQDRLSRQSGSQLLTSTTPALVPYKSPNPSPGSGTHEYLILLYQQTGPISVRDFRVSAFNLQDFLAKSGLQGHLVAGTFFKSTYDGKSFPIQGNSQQEPRISRAPLRGHVSVGKESPVHGSLNSAAKSTSSAHHASAHSPTKHERWNPRK